MQLHGAATYISFVHLCRPTVPPLEISALKGSEPSIQQGGLNVGQSSSTLDFGPQKG